MKTIHIHTDYKFVHNTHRFEGPKFTNHVIIFKKDKPYKGPYEHSAKLYGKEEIDDVIRFCKDADLVILYNLEILKSKIVLALPGHVNIAWRFFGTEFYSRMEKTVLSEKSLKAVTGLKKTTKDFLRPFYHRIKYGNSLDKVFFKAIDRIDYMLILNKKEYEFLSTHFGKLPEYIRFPIRKERINGGSTNVGLKKKNKIVLGNSKQAFNNHLDILEEIEKTESRISYNFRLLFNYGPENNYTKAVRKFVKGKSYYSMIEEFIPAEEFKDFYDDINALVINGYRQMAMGNIFLALSNGVKVYLNKKNVMMHWLLSEGIEVFPIENLSIDLENDNIKLDEKTACNNLENLKKIYTNSTEEDLQKTIYLEIDRE